MVMKVIAVMLTMMTVIIMLNNCINNRIEIQNSLTWTIMLSIVKMLIIIEISIITIVIISK